MPDIVLFRTPTPTDTYGPLLDAAGYSSTSVAALTVEISTAELVPILVAGAAPWEAVIVTSRRAADAWVRAVGEVEREVAEDPAFVPWSRLTVYSPGPAVAAVLSQVDPAWRPQSTTALSAAALAPIVIDASPRTPGRYSSYLMLVGDKTLPTLPAALDAAARDVTKIKAYATSEAPSLSDSVRDIHTCAWGVLFSPSSSGYVLRHLENTGWRVRPGQGGKEIKLAAIGETTAGFLRDNGYRCDAVARSPDARGAIEAICSADGRNVPAE